DIVRPPFYETVRGTLWHSASMPEPIDPNAQNGANVMETTFDPANPPHDREWTGAERKMVQEYQEQKRKEEAEARKSRIQPRQPPLSPAPPPAICTTPPMYPPASSAPPPSPRIWRSGPTTRPPSPAIPIAISSKSAS